VSGVDPGSPRATSGGSDGLARLAAADWPGNCRHAAHVRKAIDDTGELGDLTTADLHTEVSRTIDKRLWFLEAHLQG